jgi:hypothetical protein
MASRGKKTAEEIAPVERNPPAPRKTIRRPASRRTKAKKGGQPLTIWEKLEQWAGCLEGVPSDFARNHDHSLHGTPRKGLRAESPRSPLARG